MHVSQKVFSRFKFLKPCLKVDLLGSIFTIKWVGSCNIGEVKIRLGSISKFLKSNLVDVGGVRATARTTPLSISDQLFNLSRNVGGIQLNI